MRFTWWTYIVARHRAIKAETLEFQQHASAFRGPHAWMSRWEYTEALARRHKRERTQQKTLRAELKRVFKKRKNHES